MLSRPPSFAIGESIGVLDDEVLGGAGTNIPDDDEEDDEEDDDDDGADVADFVVHVVAFSSFMFTLLKKLKLRSTSSLFWSGETTTSSLVSTSSSPVMRSSIAYRSRICTAVWNVT